MSIVLVGATLEPLRRDPYDDGFPLSPYAMFAEKRATTVSLNYPLGITAAGERRYLSPALIGSSEILQAKVIVDSAIRRGPKEVRALCERIAARVAAIDDYDDVRAIRIVTGRHEAIAFLTRDERGAEKLRGECEVPR